MTGTKAHEEHGTKGTIAIEVKYFILLEVESEKGILIPYIQVEIRLLNLTRLRT